MGDYPAAIPSINTVTSTQSLASASHSTLHNQIAEEIVNITTELGTDPAGSFPTVKARLEALELGTTDDATVDALVATSITVSSLKVVTLSFDSDAYIP